MPDWLVQGNPPQETWFEERCFITEHLNHPASPEMSLALARVAPGVTTRLHAVAGITERYVIRAGEGRVEVGGAQADVVPGDTVVIPPGVPQRIRNTGAGDLEFYCICTPRFEPEAYRDLEADGEDD